MVAINATVEQRPSLADPQSQSLLRVDDSGPADRLRGFQNGNLQALRSEIIGAGKAVMTRADDDDVEFHPVPTGIEAFRLKGRPVRVQ